ncbi:hypothetical protein MTQ24_00720 [Corynebacterium bovis]
MMDSERRRPGATASRAMSNWKDVVPVDAGAGAVPAWANGVPDCPPAWAPPKGTPAPAPEVEDAEEAKGAGAAAPAGPDAPSDAPPACQPSSKASRRSQAMSTTPSGPRSASS